MKFLVALLFIGLAAAEHAFAPGKVFIYKHKHEVKAGYPSVAAPLAPEALTADVKIQAASANKVFVQLAAVSAKASPYAALLEKPFAANIKQGVIKSLEVAPDLPAWGVNIVKAKMSVFNLNLMGLPLFAPAPAAEAAAGAGAAPNAEKAFFNVMEETHFGLCEAAYAISALPAHLAACKEECVEVPEEVKAAAAEHLLVTKIVDTHKCKAMPQIAHAMPPVANVVPYAPAMNALYSKVVVTQYVIHGDRSNFLVKSIKHVERVALNPMRGETAKLLLETVSSFKLAAIAPAAAAPALPFAPKVVKSVVSELVPMAEAAVADVAAAPIKKLLPIGVPSAAVIAKAVAIVAEIADAVEAPVVDPAQAVVATKVLALQEALAFMDLAEIAAAYGKVKAAFAGAKFVTAKAFVLDAAAMAGTGPCVAFIKKLVLAGEVPEAQAAVIIMTLPMTIKAPTPAVIKEVHDMVHALKAVSETLYTTGLLAVSNVVYHHCVKPAFMGAVAPAFAATASGVKFCDPATPEVVAFVNHAAAELKAANKVAVKVAAIKALANTAHPAAVAALKPVVVGAVGDEFVRVLAITSLHRAAECHKAAVIDIAMGVFVNLKEAHTVRIAAATVVLANHPHHHLLAKLAVCTWFEPSIHVHTFVHTALKCLAVAKLPVDPMVNHAAKAALALCKPHPAIVPASFHCAYADYIREFNVGAVAGASVIGSGKSVVPLFVQKFFMAMEGYPSKRFEAAFAAQGVEEAILGAVGKQNAEQVMELIGAIHPQARAALKEKIEKMMVQAKFEAVDPVKAAASFRIADAIEGIAVLDGAAGLVEKVVAMAVQAVAALQAGVPVNVQKAIPLVDAMVVVPTEVGYPAQVRIVVPVVVSIKGSVKATLGAAPAVEAVVKPLISAAYHAKATVFGIPTAQVAEAGILAVAQIAIPATKIVAAVNPVAKAVEIKVVPAAVAAPVKAVHVFAAPYTAVEPFANLITEVTAMPSFKPIMRGAPIKELIASPVVKAMAGVVAGIEHETDSPLATIHQIKAFLLANYASPLSVAAFPQYLIQKVINYQKINAIVDFAASPAKEFKVVVKYFPTVAKEVADSWRAAAAEAPVEGIWSTVFAAGEEQAREEATPVAVQVQKPYGSQLEGAKVHNVKVVVKAVGPAAAIVYEQVVSAAVTADFKVAHVKSVLAVPAIPAVVPVPYKVIVETSVANHVSKVVVGAEAKYGKVGPAEAPEKIQVKAKVDKSEAAIAEEAEAGVKAFDRVSVEVVKASGRLPAPIHKIIKAAEHVLTFAFYPYMSAEYPAAIAAGKVAVDVVVNPKLKVCNLIIKKEAEVIAFKGIPVPAILADVLPVPVNAKGIEQLVEKINEISGGIVRPKCVVDAAKVITFDGVKVPAAAIPVGKEVVLAKFIGSADTAVVSIVKKAAGQVVKVVKAGRVIEVEVAAAGAAVAVDGVAVAAAGVVPVVVEGVVVAKIVPVAEGVMVVSPIFAIPKEVVEKAIAEVSKVVDIAAIAGEAAEIELADRVIVKRDAVVVKVTALSRGKMVGVCGNFNGEKFDEFEVREVQQEAVQEVQPAQYMEAEQKRIDRLFSRFTME